MTLLAGEKKKFGFGSFGDGKRIESGLGPEKGRELKPRRAGLRSLRTDFNSKETDRHAQRLLANFAPPSSPKLFEV